MVWFSHLFKNFPVCVIHTVKGFGIVNNAEVDVFLEFSCFIYNPKDVGNLISGSFAFSKTSMKYLEVHGSRIAEAWLLSIPVLAYEMSEIVWWFEHSLALPFFGIGMKTDLFQSCGHC